MLKLKNLLAQCDSNQAELAQALGLSRAAIAQIVNHCGWPKSLDETDLKERILDFLEARGIAEPELLTAFEDVNQAASAKTPTASSTPVKATKAPAKSPVTPEEETMLLRKQTLHPSTRKHFGMFRDPFSDDAVQSHEDMYVSPDIRYVREAMFQTARHGGLLAVVSQSGAGKTTLLRDLSDRIAREKHPITLVRPYVLGMEDNDTMGKTLKATHIAEALMSAVSPLERPASSPEARFAQLHRALTGSHAAGYHHCLVIDEAHSLPIPTIKHLKRFFELEVGFKKLLSIILMGQSELKQKLDERDPRVREVVQRCEVVELAPLDGGRLNEYLKFKFDRAGKPLVEVIDQAGIDALRAKLTQTTTRRDRTESVSLLYPLAIANLLTASMNLAAEIGVPTVTADVIREV